jgi:hypothetical protein
MATTRTRYNRGSIESTMTAAKKSAAFTGEVRYVIATALGYSVEKQPAPFKRACHKVEPDGSVTTVGN